MKTLIGLLSVLVCFSVIAGGRRTQQSSADPFCLWQTNSDFLWLASQPAPDPTGVTPGPSFFFRNDGSRFIGPNVNQDVHISYTSILYPLYSTTLIASNEPSSQLINLTVADSENYSFYSDFSVGLESHSASGHSYLNMDSATEDGHSANFLAFLDPSGGAAFLSLSADYVQLFKADKNGVIANGFSVGTSAGLTTNISVVLPDTSTIQLQFTGGILTGIASP